jgi:predicted pyridoxine 5'-phosphate oxidase superfamily flavin-nucleotide-binding protein
MAKGFMDIATTPSVEAAQVANGSREFNIEMAARRVFDRFDEDAVDFIATRDSFYVATVSETGWPYIQHRGGPPGFLKVLDERTLGMADFAGNRQYLTVGNLAASDKAALFLMDYRRRGRMKIFARAEAVDLSLQPDLAARLATPGYRARIERGLLFRLEAYDWNCSQHITPRYTIAEVEQAVTPLREQLQALEAENAALRAQASAPA